MIADLLCFQHVQRFFPFQFLSHYTYFFVFAEGDQEGIFRHVGIDCDIAREHSLHVYRSSTADRDRKIRCFHFSSQVCVITELRNGSQTVFGFEGELIEIRSCAFCSFNDCPFLI